MATAAELKARLAKYATASKKEVEDDTPKTPQTPAIAAPEQAVRTERDAETPAVLAQEVLVCTDVQSADVVIVERHHADSEQTENSLGLNNRNAGDNEGQGTDLDTNNPVHQNFLQRLADVEAALLARDPLMKTHLGEIHKHMIQYEEIANLLRPHEVAKIMAAQQAHVGISLRAEVLGKSKAAASKKAAKISVGDL